VTDDYSPLFGNKLFFYFAYIFFPILLVSNVGWDSVPKTDVRAGRHLYSLRAEFGELCDIYGIYGKPC
jgi:hypothetical protein